MAASTIWAIILLGVASNLDNGGVGIAYGVRRISISFWSNLLIAGISFIATAVSGVFGQYIAHWLSPIVANVFGMIVLVAVGIWVLYQPFRKKSSGDHSVVDILQNPERADKDGSKSIGLWEAAILGVALAMNALAGGFDAGLTGLSVLWTAISVGTFSLLLLGGAAYVGGKYAARVLGDRASIVAGLLLILIGLHQVL